MFCVLLLLYNCVTVRKSIAQTSKIIYKYSLDLNELKDDQLSISLKINGLKMDTIQFCFAKIIPGIYSFANYGNSVSKIQFLDANGKSLNFKKLDENRWEIYGAKKLNKINYSVNDNWESLENGFNGRYFMTESSFDPNVFVLNHNTIFGYFRGLEKHPYQIVVSKPKQLYGATSLASTVKPNKIVFTSESYNQLIDNPILFSKPDTAFIDLPQIKIQVACFSTSGKPLAKELATFIEPLLINQAKYLNGNLPVNKYSFIIYHNDKKDTRRMSSQGLEHANSTLILLNGSFNVDAFKNVIYGTASHEFFHILMPLGIHSDEIANYDFNNPKFSKHLWLYEGMTEYFTIHMPVVTKLQSLKDFLSTLESKIKESKKYKADLSFVDLSLNSMTMEDQYLNVYQKGSLINLCLDIRLRELSAGKFGVQDLVASLLKKYGPKKSFRDEKLFDEIVEITGYPQIRDFFKLYVEQSNKLPLEESLNKVGLKLIDEQITELPELTYQQKNLRKAWIGQ